MDGESDCSSTFGNFLPKKSERGTGASERQEQDRVGSTSEMDAHGREKRAPVGRARDGGPRSELGNGIVNPFIRSTGL